MSPRITAAELSAHRAKRPLPRKESEILRAILDYLKVCPGVTAWKQNVGAMFGEHKGKRWAVRFGFPGMSDIAGWVSRVGRCYACLMRGSSCVTHRCCADCEHPREAIALYVEVKLKKIEKGTNDDGR